MNLNEAIQLGIEQSLSEDIGAGDVTALLLPENAYARADIITREPMVMCGFPWLDAIIQTVGNLKYQALVKEGENLPSNTVLCQLEGPVRTLVTIERTLLNFIQTLSGTATLTRAYVNAIQGTQTKILDTRKTIPNLRIAQKYAVRIGGGYNHRIGLYDAFLIKENHLKACGGMKAAVGKARALHPELPIIVEVETLDELQQALQANPDRILLDNYPPDKMKEAVHITQKRIPLEVSGGVTLETVKGIAQTGVDYISIGSLTKHVRAIDLTMLIRELL